MTNPQETKKDYSLRFLVLTNIIFGLYFLLKGGEFGALLWVYWIQSVIIGVINFIRILTQKNFSVEGMKVGGRPVKKTEGQKIYTAFFFIIHYGFFHAGYFLFLSFLAPQNFTQQLLLGSLLFGANHIVSFAVNFKRESLIEKNIGYLMFIPYIRIVPMHIIIILGIFLMSTTAGNIIGLIIFITLKTLADALLHKIEHAKLSEVKA